MARSKGVGMRRPMKKKPTAVEAVVTAAVADTITESPPVEPISPAPPECAPSPASAPAPVPPVPRMLKKRGRPPKALWQLEETKIKRMRDAYLSAEADCVNKTEAARNNAYHRLYGPFDIKNPRELPKSIEARIQEKYEKRRRKADELETAWQNAAEQLEVQKRLRAYETAIKSQLQVERVEADNKLLQAKYELAEFQRECAEAARVAAEEALQRSAAENRRLLREVRHLRSVVAGDDEWEDEEDKLACDLEWCEQYLRGQNPSCEDAVAAVRDAAWDEASAESEMIAASNRRQSCAAMPPPLPRASVVPLSCVGTPHTVVRASRVQ